MGKLQFPVISTLVILAALSGESEGNCTNVVVSVSPCLNYGNSSAAPSAACCAQLNTVARSRPECLCQVIDGGGSATLGLTVDQTQAQALPKACNVQTTNCKGGGSGSSSPGNGSSATSCTFFAIFLAFTSYFIF